jgi:hypothetical protein
MPDRAIHLEQELCWPSAVLRLKLSWKAFFATHGTLNYQKMRISL